MYAIVETSGRQLRVTPGETVQVDHLDAEVGAEITLDRVLMVGGDAPRLGTPLVEGAEVRARVVGHDKGPKVRSLMIRRRKRARVRKAFRATHTLLEILDIKA